LREKLDARLVAARRAEGQASPDPAGGVSPPGKTAGLEAPYPNDQMIVAVKDAEIRL
jgi:hypothetical protein